MKLSCIAVLLGLIAVSCGPTHREKLDQIDSLRSEAERLIEAQSVMGWENWVFGKMSRQDSLYRVYEGLFAAENIRLVLEVEKEELDAVQRKRLRYFRRYLTTELIAREVAPLTDSASNIEATATIALDDERIPYREVSSKLSAERDQNRRLALYEAMNPVLDSLNRVLIRVEQVNQDLGRSLGYPSYNDMVQDLKGIDLGEFQIVCERILNNTEEMYSNLLREQLEEEGLVPERFHRYDTGNLLRSSRFINYFPAESMLGTATTTFASLGIDIGQIPNLYIDTEPRENKNPRAVCFTVNIPSDIRLSIKPIGGADDYLGLFHELGHGLHYAHTTEHSLEFRYLGEPTVTETFAFLCQYLIANQAWLRQQSRMPVPVLKEFIRFQGFSRLYFIRRYSAKFLYELDLHSGRPAPATRYAELLSRGTGYRPLPSDEKRYLTDVDALYYSAGYLRAWFLEAQISATLETRFGVNWFENPAAGEFLKTLWARGDRLNGDELAADLGYEVIEPAALIDRIEMMILFSTP